MAHATAAAVQVNNVNIIRGMLGKPGAGILPMNGPPTAQNTRECGADGDLPGFRNWSNDAHITDLARIWNIDQMQIPHYSAPRTGAREHIAARAQRRRGNGGPGSRVPAHRSPERCTRVSTSGAVNTRSDGCRQRRTSSQSNGVDTVGRCRARSA